MVLAFHIWSNYHRYPNHSSLHLHAEILRRRCNRRSSQIKSIMYIENFRQVNIGSFFLRKCRTYLLFPFYMRLLISYRQKISLEIIPDSFCISLIIIFVSATALVGSQKGSCTKCHTKNCKAFCF